MPYVNLDKQMIVTLQDVEERPHPDAGFVALQKKNGKYLSVTATGDVQERDNPGADEQFIKTGKGYVADRSGYPNGVIIGILTL